MKDIIEDMPPGLLAELSSVTTASKLAKVISKNSERW
jgi:hypothetical protein